MYIPWQLVTDGTGAPPISRWQRDAHLGRGTGGVVLDGNDTFEAAFHADADTLTSVAADDACVAVGSGAMVS
jgi:hypothetical protein